MFRREVISVFYREFNVTVNETNWSKGRKHQMPKHSVWFNHDLELVDIGILTPPEQPTWKTFTFETDITVKCRVSNERSDVRVYDEKVNMYLANGVVVVNRFQTEN